MSMTLEGMARAAYRAQYGAEFDSLRDGVREQFMKAALLWLADNVSDEMVAAHSTTYDKVGLDKTHEESVRQGLSAALRAAAGDGK